MNQSYKNLKYPYQIKDAIKSNDLSIFWFPFSVKVYKGHGEHFILPSPRNKNTFVLVKNLGIEGRWIERTLWHLVIRVYDSWLKDGQEKYVLSFWCQDLSSKRIQGKKKPVRLGYAEVFCNWTPSELELILNRCLFHPL